MLDDDVAAGRIDKLAARHAFNRVAPTTEWTGLELADVVVEAVRRDDGREARGLREARPAHAARLPSWRPTPARCASRRSPQATRPPERVVGLHFFNPVPKMPLVEVVRGAASDDASLATAVGARRQIGKTPVLVKDAPGFLVNRVLIPYLAEALVDGDEGMPITDDRRGDEAVGHADGAVRAARRDRPGRRCTRAEVARRTSSRTPPAARRGAVEEASSAAGSARRAAAASTSSDGQERQQDEATAAQRRTGER